MRQLYDSFINLINFLNIFKLYDRLFNVINNKLYVSFSFIFMSVSLSIGSSSS